MDAPMLILILSVLITVPSKDVLANEPVNPRTALLTELMRLQSNVTSVNWNLEESVKLLRNALFKRIRCGSESGIEPKICEECLSSSRILSIASGNDSSIPNRTNRHENITPIEDLSRLTVVFLNYFLTFQTSCTPESVRKGYIGSCSVYYECWSEIHQYVDLIADKNSMEIVENIEKILRKVKAVYEPDPSKNCFSAEKILNELDNRSEKFKALPRDIATVLLITSHLVSGECIDVGESVADFLDDIFLHYGDRCERIITQSGFTKLWNDLQMQRKGKHIDHGVQKNSCEYPSSKSQMLRRTEEAISSNGKVQNLDITDINFTTTITGTSIKNTEYNVNLTHEAHTISNSNNFPVTESKTEPTERMKFEEHSDSEKVTFTYDNETSTTDSVTIRGVIKIPQKSDVLSASMESKLTEDNIEVKNVTYDTNASSSKRIVRHTHIPEDHEHKNLANECLPSEDLLRRFLTPGKKNKVITSLEFLQLCPALIQQAVSGVCNTRLMKGTEPLEPLEIASKNETGVLFEESKRGNPWNAVAAVVAITAASLLGLFLLPLLKKPVFVFVNAFFTGLAFGTMSGDVVLHIMPQYLGLHKHDENEHGHNEAEETIWERYFPVHLQRQLLFLLTMYLLFIIESIFSTFSGEKQDHHGHSHGPIEIPMKDFDVSVDVENAEAKKSSDCMRAIRFFKPSNIMRGITAKVIVILLADTVHNFADGMAIAVGFSLSNKDGLSTSVAVFFHELPHEIGDFALLMNFGLSYWQAFFFNIVSGFTAFVGLGVGVFSASAFREWLLCITAGLFFFVVMGEMLPDMRLQSKEKWREFLVKIMGTVFGMFAMICIAIYEQIGAL